MMKHIVPILLSFILTGSMAFGYFYGIDSLVNFAVTLYWILIILATSLSVLISIMCLAIDEGKMSDENKQNLFKNLGKKRNPFKVVTNSIMTLSNITLLVLSGFGVTACFYFISSGLAIWARTAVIKRRVDQDVDNLHK